MFLSAVNTFTFLILLFILGDYSVLYGADPIQCDTTYSTGQAQRLFQLGEEAKLKGEFEAALNYFEKALRISQSQGNEADQLNCHLKLGILYWDLGKIKESSKEYSAARVIAKGLGVEEKANICSSAILISELYIRGKDYRNKGDVQESIATFNRAIDIARKIRSKEHELKCLRQLSIGYWQSENVQEFFSLNRLALSLAETLSHRQEQSMCLNNLGLFYWKLDNYSEALSFYQRSLNIASVIKGQEIEAECLGNMGIVYFDLGEYDRALEQLTRALAIDRGLKDTGNILKDLINIGECYRRKGLLTGDSGNFLLAKDNFLESLRLLEKIDDKSSEILILNDLGATHSHLGENGKALEYFLSALKKSEPSHNIEAIGMILNNIGIVYSQLGKYEESTKYYQRAIDLALGIKGGKILWEAYLEIADAYKKQHKYQEALENYKRSISVIENIRSGINLEELKASYLGTDKRIDAYYNIIDLYIQLYQRNHEESYKADAFYYLEKAKARSFLDSIEVSKLNLTDGISQKLLNRETDTMNEISRLHTRLLAPQLSPEQRKAINTDLENYEDQLDSLKREMRGASPVYASLNYPTTMSLKEAQQELLDDETTCFAYLLGKENSYGFAVTKKDIKIFVLPPKGDIQKLVQQHLQAVTDLNNQDFRTGYLLYGCLLKPGLSSTTKKILIIPDDALYFLPFETLLTKGQGREWLIKKYVVAYVPSLSSLRELIERNQTAGQKPRKDILAIGDPSFGAHEIEATPGDGTASGQNPGGSESQFYRLKYSGQEVEKIASLFKPQKRGVLLREQATEKNLKNENLSDFKIIHFATHALIDDKKPARSAIVLSLQQDRNEDGFLQMREVFNLRLHADLVTLSACETGLGRLVRGEGVEGLSRAFFYAGASSVLLSLWAINDQASYQLLERFYFHLRSSVPIMNALRKAKIEMINSRVLDHPYYWGGFIITGEADKVIIPHSLKRWIIATLSLGVGLAILFLVKNRDRSPLYLIKS